MLEKIFRALILFLMNKNMKFYVLLHNIAKKKNFGNLIRLELYSNRQLILVVKERRCFQCRYNICNILK